MPPIDDQEGQRKLAAILAADVAGYSKLMADDERATIASLKVARAVFRERIEAHAGRLIDTTGDCVLAEFRSPIEAVECAVEIQRQLKTINEPAPDHRQMHFRIGVNLGDVIEEADGTIYGDGVNVAARLEGLAEPGGIMLADVARQTVEGKLDVGLADAGEHEVKNIAKPVRAWRVLLDGEEAGAPVAKTFRRPKVIAGLAAALAVVIGLAVWGVAVRVEVPQMVMADGTPTDDPILAMPTGPSIIVLPFENLSTESDQQYFADGITIDILSALRVRPETLCRIIEFSEHESNGRELDEGERVAVEVLPVLGQSAAAVEPGDGAFDHPTPGLDDEALHPIGSLDDLGLEIGQDAGQGAVKDRALIGAVGEQFPEKGKQTEQGRQQRETAVAILNVGGGDDAVQQQALRIDQNMPLLALDQLAGIEAVAVDASPPFSALFTL